MCVALQIDAEEVNLDEWNFFLKGGQVLDRAAQIPKPPFEWITQTSWDNITELEKAIPETFTGISNAISLNNKEWNRWFLSVTPAPPESA
jgi:dynein heavy chain